MLSLLYSTALFLSNSAEAPRAPAYAPSFCRRTDCNCSPYRTASTQQNTLARRPLRPFPPAATPVALALLSTRSPVNTHAPIPATFPGAQLSPRKHSRMPTHAPFSARRYAGRNCSLIDTLTCQHPRAESRFLFAPPPTAFPPAAATAANRSLIDTLTCQHPRAESRFLFAPPPARFSARRYAGCTRSLIYVLTCHNMR